MAWTNPKTWVTREIPTAADLNRELRDNLAYLHEPPQCVVKRNNNLSIPNNAFTQVGFGTEVYDPLDMHSTATNSERVFIPDAGLYLFVAWAQFNANTTGIRRLRFTTNGGNSFAEDMNTAPNGAENTRLNCSGLRRMDAGQWVAVEAFQTSGAGLNLLGETTADELGPRFAVCRVG